MREPIPSSIVRQRRDFAALCNARELFEAVEVGTDRGGFAVEFLTHWRGNTLVCIDPYQSYPEMPWDRQADQMMAIARLSAFGDRARFIRSPSPDAIGLLPAGWRIDFIYIDGAHDEASAWRDINAWWNRLRGGGVLAGHDFDPEHPGVMRAVERFADQFDLQICVTSDAHTTPSWYAEKRK